MHYFDHSATSPVLPEVIPILLDAMQTHFGNPSSQHALGITASKALQTAREQVADALSVLPEEILFTSGGTESINTAIVGACRKQKHRGRHIVTTSMEHVATLHTVQSLHDWEVTYIAPDASGHIAADALLSALRPDTVLVSCMLVNNEVGTTFPVQDIGAGIRTRSPHALFHIDAVQGLFRVPIAVQKWNCDLLSISGHKIGAPKGVGALYRRKGLQIPPLLHGGGQEQSMRAGTEAMPNILAFGRACAIRKTHMQTDLAHVHALQTTLQKRIKEALPFAIRNGTPDVPHIVNYSFEGCKSEVLLRLLEMRDVYVSAGSACAKGKQSHVLSAMGLPANRIDSALRISLSPSNTPQDIDALIDALMEGTAKLRAFS